MLGSSRAAQWLREMSSLLPQMQGGLFGRQVLQCCDICRCGNWASAKDEAGWCWALVVDMQVSAVLEEWRR